jgi:hypothetical protein
MERYICDIPVINVQNPYTTLNKYVMLILFYENKNCCCMDGTRCNQRLTAIKTVDGQQDYTKTSIIGIYLEY